MAAAARVYEVDAPTADVSLASDAPVPEPETEADQGLEDLGIEDAVVRELARAPQPWGRG